MRVRKPFLTILCVLLSPSLIGQGADSLLIETNGLADHLGQQVVNSDSTWFDGQYLNAGALLTERLSNSAQDFYEAGIANPNISFRKQGPALMTLNDIPLNIYDVNIYGQLSGQVEYRDYISLPQSNLLYIGTTELGSVSASKNTLSSANYGTFGKNGVIAFNSYVPTQDGWSVEMNSGFWFTRNQNATNQITIDGHTLRNGAKIGYQINRFRSSFNLELLNQFLASNTPATDNASFRGINLSSTNQYDITEKLQADLFVNYFTSDNIEAIREVSYWDDDQNNSRVIGRMGLTYSPTKFLTLQAFSSKMQLTNDHTYVYGLNSSVSTNSEWKQNYHSIKATYEQTFGGRFGVKSSVTYNVLNRKFERSSSGNAFGFEYEFDDKFLASEVTFDYDKWIYLGGFLNAQNTSLLMQSDDPFISRGIHGAMDIFKLIKVKTLNSAMIRVNLTYVELPTATFKGSEYGLDLSLLKGKIDLSATYFKNLQDHPIQTYPIISGNSTTSNSVYYYNNYDREYSGFDVSIATRPMKNWRMNLNWSKNNYKTIDNTLGTQSNIVTSSFGGNLSGNANVGVPLGVLQGSGLLYGSGNIPVTTTIATSEEPLWTSNLFNTVDIGKLTVGCLLSYQYGGSTYDYEVNSTNTANFDPDRAPLSNYYYGAYYWGNASRNPGITVRGLDALVLRNIYVNYEFKKVLKTQSIRIGLAAKNLWASTKLENNRIPAETFSNYSAHSLKTYSINLTVRL